MNYDIIPPTTYNIFWVWVATAVTAFVCVYVATLLIATMPRKPRVATPTPTPVLRGEAARQHCMVAIDQLAADHAAGKYNASQVTQQLGVILRAFAADYSGLRTRPMTLTELQRAGVPSGLVQAIESFYPVAFGVMMEKESPAAALAHAKELVYRWN
jgi:hypothetical protein